MKSKLFCLWSKFVIIIGIIIIIFDSVEVAKQQFYRSIILYSVYLDDLSKTCSLTSDCSIILYADNILLLSISVTRLEQLLHACECELTWLDMSINFSKSCCLRIGPRCDIPVAGVNSLSGQSLPWVNEMRYLGVYIGLSSGQSL